MWPEPHHLPGTLSHPQSTFISNHLWHIWLCEGLIWWYPLQLHHIVFASCPGGKNLKGLKACLALKGQGWPPSGQPLGSGGQELVCPVSRPFWDPFYHLFNLCQWARAPDSQSSDQYTVEQNFPVFLLPFLVSFPQVNYLHTGSRLRFCFLGNPASHKITQQMWMNLGVCYTE